MSTIAPQSPEELPDPQPDRTPLGGVLSTVILEGLDAYPQPDSSATPAELVAVTEGVPNRPSEEIDAMPDSPEVQENPNVRVERVAYGQPGFSEAQRMEYEVFRSEGYTDKDPTDPERPRLVEYESRDPYSIYNLLEVRKEVTRRDGSKENVWELRSVLREIHAPALLSDKKKGVVGFKTTDDYEEAGKLFEDWRLHVDSDPRNVIEIGTAATPKKFRHKSLGYGARLYHSSFKNADEMGKKTCIASIDDGLLAYYVNPEKPLFNFVQIGESLLYMGSPTTPVACDIAALPGMLKEKNPAFYDVLVKGKIERLNDM